MEQLNAFLLYFAGVNIVAFILMGIDKQKAKKGAYRIPERTFWSLAIIGGAIGAFFGMRRYRHKTKHRSFIIGMPILICIHFGLFLYIYSLLS